MSYAMSAALQSAVFAALAGQGDLQDAVGTDIFDAMPSGTGPPLYVALGPEQVRIDDAKTGSGAIQVFVVSVVTALTRGRLVSLRFRSAKAARIDKGAGRKIDLTFRARVEDD